MLMGIQPNEERLNHNKRRDKITSQQAIKVELKKTHLYKIQVSYKASLLPFFFPYLMSWWLVAPTED